MLRPGVQIGPYLLQQELGRGAFGVVFRAVKAGPVPIPVALKVALLPTEAADEFLKEAKVWARVSGHPHVVPIQEAGIYDGLFVLVSEFIEGGTLADYLEALPGQRTPGARAVEIVEGILDGLEHLHAQGVLHQDLKPANVLLQAGRPRLSDFGIARAGVTTVRIQGLAGTPAYMPPEAFSGTIGRRTDIWAAGVILYELLAGRVPFAGANQWALMDAIRSAPLPPLPEDVPPALAAVVEGALQRDREQRFTTAGEMREALIGARRRPLRRTPVDAGAGADGRGVSGSCGRDGGAGAGPGRGEGRRIAVLSALWRTGPERWPRRTPLADGGRHCRASGRTPAPSRSTTSGAAPYRHRWFSRVQTAPEGTEPPGGDDEYMSGDGSGAGVGAAGDIHHGGRSEQSVR